MREEQRERIPWAGGGPGGFQANKGGWWFNVVEGRKGGYGLLSERTKGSMGVALRGLEKAMQGVGYLPKVVQTDRDAGRVGRVWRSGGRSWGREGWIGRGRGICGGKRFGWGNGRPAQRFASILMAKGTRSGSLGAMRGEGTGGAGFGMIHRRWAVGGVGGGGFKRALSDLGSHRDSVGLWRSALWRNGPLSLVCEGPVEEAGSGRSSRAPLRVK